MVPLTIEELRNKLHLLKLLDSSASLQEDFPCLFIRSLEEDEQREIAESIEDRIKKNPLRVSGKDQLDVWNKGWGEILDKIKKEGVSESTLKPQYLNNQKIIRFSGEFVEISPQDGFFKLDCFLRMQIFKKHLTDVRKVIEIGAGTGINLFLISKLFPQYHLVGADWAIPSQEIINSFRNFGVKAEGKSFDFFEPHELPIDSESAVLTVHSLEQIGNQHQKIFKLLSDCRPKFILNIEPIFEHYTDTHFDNLAKQFHQKRGYLEGYYTELLKLQKAGQINIHEDFKISLGSQYHDSFSVLKWSFSESPYEKKLGSEE